MLDNLLPARYGYTMMIFDEAQDLALGMTPSEEEEMFAALTGWDEPDMGDAPEWFFLTPGLES